MLKVHLLFLNLIYTIIVHSKCVSMKCKGAEENIHTKHLYEKGGDALNNAAIHFAYVSKFKEAMASFEDAKKIYEIIGIENRRSASHNLEYFYKIASGENDCDLKCHEKLKFAIDKGLVEFAREISKP